jgi:hypothetical protein
MKYCSAMTRGEMNKVMIIEKQRFGRGLIREISKYVYKNPINEINDIYYQSFSSKKIQNKQ